MHCDGSERTRRSAGPVRRTILAVAASTALVLAGALIGPTAAYADEYPSWDDVKNAQANEQSAQAEVSRIQGLLDGMRAEVASAQALSEQRGTEYNVAQAAFDTADYRAAELEAQAAAAQAKADESHRQAGQLAAQLGRTGSGGDLTVSLLAGGGSAGTASDVSGDLLYQLGTMSMLTSKTAQIYAQAEQDGNTAAALSAQAEVARAELEALAAEAQRLRDEAVAAQQAAEAALKEQQDHEVELQAQLQVLTENRQATEADYQKGVQARAEAARQALLAGLPTLPFIAASGWASPFPGSRSSDEYGMRVNPVSGAYLMHSGIDLVYGGGTCGATVYAAAEGLVEYAGYNGGYGNFVEIDHGGGISTGYGHNTSLLVGVGTYVQPGQPIALAGTTGNSTGCHVHFEVRQGGSGMNPRPFMQAVGIEFG